MIFPQTQNDSTRRRYLRRNNWSSVLVFGTLLVIAMSAAALQSLAGCGSVAGTSIFEFEVSSCALPSEDLKAVFETERTARPTYDPPPDFAQSEEQREASKARAEKMRLDWEKYFAAKSQRLLSIPALILEGKMIRQKHFDQDPRLDPSAKAEWKETDVPRRILLRTNGSTHCSGVIGKKVVLLATPECCDVDPPQGLACVLRLAQAELVPDIAGDEQPGEEAKIPN